MGRFRSQGLKRRDILSGAEDGASGWWSPTLGNRGTGDTVALAHSKQARTQRVAITRRPKTLKDSFGATPFGVCGSVRGAEGTAVRRGASSQATETRLRQLRHWWRV